jgi:hypothetical protein
VASDSPQNNENHNPILYSSQFDSAEWYSIFTIFTYNKKERKREKEGGEGHSTTHVEELMIVYDDDSSVVVWFVI